MNADSTTDARRTRLPNWWLVGAAATMLVLLAVFIHLVNDARHAAQDSVCHAYLYKLRHAILLYETNHGSLPPAVYSPPGLEVAHSWRVQILPYLYYGSDGEAFDSAYDRSLAWNDPANRRLCQSVENEGFACPRGSDKDTMLTNYVVLVGDDTLFPPVGSVKSSDLPNSVDPILVVEITNSNIGWSEPRDLVIDELDESNGENSIVLTKPHEGAIRYITLSGRLGMLPEGTSVDEVKRLASITGQAATAE